MLTQLYYVQQMLSSNLTDMSQREGILLLPIRIQIGSCACTLPKLIATYIAQRSNYKVVSTLEIFIILSLPLSDQQRQWKDRTSHYM